MFASSGSLCHRGNSASTRASPRRAIRPAMRRLPPAVTPQRMGGWSAIEVHAETTSSREIWLKVTPVSLTGARAKVIPMEASHAEALYQAGGSPEIWPYMPMWPKTPDDMRRLVREALGTIRVQLKTDARNLRSQQAIERIGGVREGVLRHHRIMPDGYLRDSVYYSILLEEWPAVKARLEAILGKDVPGQVTAR